MAFYLKYRPQLISELDLPEVRDSLLGLLKSKSLPHALLFTGIRGTGKTSSARIWATAINCENRGKDYEPCNKCSNCESITSGRSVDVVEMDAASNRKIDDIRDLREKIRLAPTSLKYKIYIIDEVHMLTNEAFNALLKTLEEPPANVLFVLCTTETDKLPATIVSRCVRVNFRMAGREEIANSLTRVAKGEKINIDKEGINLVADLGEGSFRDATKMLEEIAWMEGKITKERVEEFFHIVGGEMETLGQLLNKKDGLGIMSFVESRASGGGDIKLLAGRILDYLHEEWKKALAGKSSLDYSAGEIGSLIDRVDEYWWRFNTALKAQLPLELALISWLEDQGGDGNKKMEGKKTEVKSEIKPELKVQVQEVKTPMESKEIKVEVKENQPKVSILNSTSSDTSVESIVLVWDEILGNVRQRNISVEAFLRAARPVRLFNNRLILELAYSFHRDKLLEEANRRLVEEVVSNLVGLNLGIECELNTKPSVSIKDKAMDTKPAFVPSASRSVASENVTSVKKYGGGFGRRTISTQSPVPTEEDDALVEFAEDLFGK